MWARRGGTDAYEGTDTHALPLFRFQTAGVRYIAGISLDEALKLSGSMTLNGAQDWLASLTPSSPGLKKATTFFVSEVQPGEALYIPQAFLYVEQARG